MTPTKTETTPGILLQSLTTTGNQVIDLANNGETQADSSESRPSSPVSYDAELCTARRLRVQKVEPELHTPLRFRPRQVLRNKYVRRTFWVTALLGIVSILYNNINMIPALRSANAAVRAVEIQLHSESDSRHSLTLDFLQECSSRKSQGLPLGSDCLKYLLKTPKAPSDIDNWMIDPQSSNMSGSTIAQHAKLSKRQLASNYPPSSKAATSDHHWIWFIIVLLSMAGVVLLLGADGTYRRIDRTLRIVLDTAHRVLDPYLGRTGTSYLAWLILVCIWTLFLWLFTYQGLYKRWRWTAAAEFLEICKIQKERNFPTGDDCTKYLEKELKPPPRLNSIEMTTFALAAMGIGASILGAVAQLVMFRRRGLMTERMYQDQVRSVHIPSSLGAMTLSVEESEIDLEEHSSNPHLAFARLIGNEMPTTIDLPVLGYEISSMEDFESSPSH